jgi:hypothetical protein
MKRRFATVVVAWAITGCTSGQGVASTTPAEASLTTPTVAPTPRATPSASPSTSPSPARFPVGPLAADKYTTQPFVGAGGLCMGQAGCIEAGTEDDSIRVTVTVPRGWAGLEGGGGLVRWVEGYSPPNGAALLFGRGGWLYSRLCQGPGPDIPTGTTVDGFVGALVKHPGLNVTSPVDVTLGGYSGKYLELQAPANIATNQDHPAPGECAHYFVWEPGIYAQGPNHLWHIWVLDVDGVRVVVRSDSYPGTTKEVQAQLASIVRSIQIER